MVWWLTPLVALPLVAVGHPQHRHRPTAERRDGVEDGRHLDRRWCRAASPVPTTPGPMATIATSAFATWRASASADGDRHGLEVAAERVAGGDRAVEQAARCTIATTRSDRASGRAAPSVIT